MEIELKGWKFFLFLWIGNQNVLESNGTYSRSMKLLYLQLLLFFLYDVSGSRKNGKILLSKSAFISLITSLTGRGDCGCDLELLDERLLQPHELVGRGAVVVDCGQRNEHVREHVLRADGRL